MPDKDAGTPRVYIARHGETEWTINGRYTGTTELGLTDNGVEQVLSSGRMLVGPKKLIDPSKLVQIFVSPRKRAKETYQLLFDEAREEGCVYESVAEELAEWDYGKYEGLKTNEIRERRKEQGLDTGRPWDIWKDGCEDGESAQEVSDRLDRLIEKIHNLQRPYMNGEKPADVVLVSHGHLLRAFAKRWLRYPLDTPLSMTIEPGGIGVLSYQHNNIDEPAFMLGMSFPKTAR